MGLLNDLATFCSYDINFASGSLIDSISKNSPTITGTTRWSKSNKQKGIVNESTGIISYPDTTANKLLGQGTVIIFCDPLIAPTFDKRFISKRDAGGTCYDFYYNYASGAIAVYDGSIESTFVGTITDAKFLAYTFVAGSQPNFYKDGLFFGQGSGNITHANTSVPLLIGNYYSGLLPMSKTINRAIGYSIVLTQEQISRIYEELLSTVSAGNIKRINYTNVTQQPIPETYYGIEALVDGDMESTSLSAWSVGGGSVLTKETYLRKHNKMHMIFDFVSD
jgi:hypothetical protein